MISITRNYFYKQIKINLIPYIYISSNSLSTPSEIYKSDPQTLARWLDVSIIKRKGRAFEADISLLPLDSVDSILFPPIKGTTLNGNDITIPDDIQADVKLVSFSFKHYGFTLIRSWSDPFIERYRHLNNNMIGKGKVIVSELCFVEYGFLSMAKNMFATNLKQKVNESQHNYTALTFGGISEFASNLLLPNKYTGYVYLLDKNNKIRWRGSGNAEKYEIDNLFKITDELISLAKVGKTDNDKIENSDLENKGKKFNKKKY